VIKKKPPTQKELELIKLDIQQDVERAQQAKFDLLEKEATKFRSLYYKIKKEWESAMLEQEMKSADMERQKSDLRRLHEEEVDQLRSKIQILEETVQDTSELERLRSVQREKTELELRVKAQLQELDEIRYSCMKFVTSFRAEKENLKLLAEQEERNHKRQLADMLAASKSYHSEKETLQSKCYSLENELRQAHNQKAESFEEAIRYKKELDKTISLMEEANHRYNLQVSNSQLELMKQKTELETKIEDLQTKIHLLQKEAKAAESVIQDLKDKISNQEKDYLDKLRIAKEEDWAKISQIEAEKGNVEKQLNSAKQRAAEVDARNESIIQEQAKECQRLKKELQETLALMQTLEESTQNLKLDKEHNHMSLDQAKSRADDLASKLQESLVHSEGIKTKLATATERINSLEITIKSLETKLDQVQDQSAREMEAYEHTLERQQV
jgi:chromosome segregation ATPase